MPHPVFPGQLNARLDDNKGMREVLAKGVASAAIGNQAKEAAKVMAQYRLDELKLKQPQEREKDAQVSASVSGLRAPTGIMSYGMLKRTDGTQVYKDGRLP